MSKKVLLVLVDGMRPDSLEACKHPYIGKMMTRRQLYRPGSNCNAQCNAALPHVAFP
jgi:predicted AlkP superfamily pyrophosphatase or phosphodiesterase